MAGPLDIQRYPTALVDMLGLKATGDTPHILSGEISGGLDLTRLYLYERTIYGNVPNAVAITVPGFLICTTTNFGQGPGPGQIWMVLGAGVRVPALAAATSIIVQNCVQRPSGSIIYTPIGPRISVPASTGDGDFEWFDQPVIMRPGDVFGSYTYNIVGAPGVAATMMMAVAVLGV